MSNADLMRQSQQLHDLKKELRRKNKVIKEAHRLLKKVVPSDQNLMIDWAVKSKNPVYTNAGSAYRVLDAALAYNEK